MSETITVTVSMDGAAPQSLSLNPGSASVDASPPPALIGDEAANTMAAPADGAPPPPVADTAKEQAGERSSSAAAPPPGLDGALSANAQSNDNRATDGSDIPPPPDV